MNHQPWDNGSIGQAIESVMGVSRAAYQKTIKTRCGKRVELAEADLEKPITCFRCNESLAEEKEFILEQAVALNDQRIIRAIAERTLQHAQDGLVCDPKLSSVRYEDYPAPIVAAVEIIMAAQEQVIAEQIAARGLWVS